MKRKGLTIAAIFLIMLSGLSITGSKSNSGAHSIDIPMKKGEYATGGTSGEYPDEEELQWLSKFEIVHTGNIEEPLHPEDIAYLRQHGVRVIMADDWLPASYYYLYQNNTPFMNWVYENRYNVTLNPDGPFPHCQENNYTWMHEYYFDFAVDELVARRVDYIVNGLKKIGYDGIFFDWGNGLFLQEDAYKSINATYYHRHPHTPYSMAAAQFISSLRKEMPSIVIENNQGFREAEYYLPVLDYDMAESYIVGEDYYGKKLYVDGYGLIEVPETVYYPVSLNEFNGSLNDTIYYLDYLSELREKYGGENFKRTVYMNYAAPEFVKTRMENGHYVYKPVIPKNAIYFAYAVAKLVGQISYTEVPWNHTYERCNVYFYDIGKPLGSNYEKIDGGYIRYYSNGFVIAGEWQKPTSVTIHSPYIPSNSPIYDAFEEKWIESRNHEVTIKINPVVDNLTGRMAPAGRIFVYPYELYVNITKPKGGYLYLMDREIIPIPSGNTIIIGSITVEVETNGNKVEFYIDDELQHEDDEAPYSWQWNEKAIGKHEIKVIAYDNKGNDAIIKQEVWKII